MAVFTGPVFVPNPVPIVDRYGLFTVATGPLTLPVEARGGGVQYETGVCGLPAGLEVECGPSDPEKEFAETPNVIVGTPFIVYAGMTCGLVGLDDTRARTFVMEKLKAGEQAIVENIFSQQLFGQSPGLSNNPDAFTVAATTEGVTASVAALEEAFYDTYGLAGTLHVPHLLGARLQQGGALRWDNGRWRTAAGTLVSIGNYAGFDPVGAAPAAGTSWMYITGQVTIWRTPDSEVHISRLSSSFNRTTNQAFMLAEREYVITIDCTVLGTAVTLDPA